MRHTLPIVLSLAVLAAGCELSPAPAPADASDASEHGQPSDGAVHPPTGPLTLGIFGADKQLAVPAEDAAIEIVQGPQGGVHIEVGFRLTLPGPAATDAVRVSVAADTLQPCDASAPPVGSYRASKYLVVPDPTGQALVSGAVPVIFDGNVAEPYVDRPCCVALTVQVDGATYQATHRFTCVDRE